MISQALITLVVIFIVIFILCLIQYLNDRKFTKYATGNKIDLQFNNIVYLKTSDGRYFARDGKNYVIADKPTYFKLHQHNASYLKSKYAKFPYVTSSDEELNKHTFLTDEDDEDMYLELFKYEDGYKLRRRIHMCGAFGTITVNNDKLSYDGWDGERKIRHQTLKVYLMQYEKEMTIPIYVV